MRSSCYLDTGAHFSSPSPRYPSPPPLSCRGRTAVEALATTVADSANPQLLGNRKHPRAALCSALAGDTVTAAAITPHPSLRRAFLAGTNFTVPATAATTTITITAASTPVGVGPGQGYVGVQRGFRQRDHVLLKILWGKKVIGCFPVGGEAVRRERGGGGGRGGGQGGEGGRGDRLEGDKGGAGGGRGRG